MSGCRPMATQLGHAAGILEKYPGQRARMRRGGLWDSSTDLLPKYLMLVRTSPSPMAAWPMMPIPWAIMGTTHDALCIMHIIKWRAALQRDRGDAFRMVFLLLISMMLCEIDVDRCASHPAWPWLTPVCHKAGKAGGVSQTDAMQHLSTLSINSQSCTNIVDATGLGQ